ncbi:unnamed protein product [Somion occarium]|uniref:DUF6533 domain-containing protein n=1 Tax=Somion occarium TaxID=3059160 RepID=A0ABP1CUN5_9APHY
MDPPSSFPIDPKAIAVIVHSLWAARYLSVVGLVALLYDHFLTLKDEIQLIWFSPSWGVIKWAFLYNRYVVEISLILAAYVQAGFAPSLSDLRYLAVVSMAFSNFVMVIQIYTATVICAALTLQEVHATIVHLPIAGMNTCGLSKKPPFLIGVWAGMTAFDVFILLLTLGNSLDRPHRQHIGVLSTLYRDGAIFFTALLSLRVMNFILGIIADTSQILIGSFFSWAMVSVTLSRLILRIEALKHNRQSLHIWESPPGIIEMETRVDIDTK